MRVSEPERTLTWQVSTSLGRGRACNGIAIPREQLSAVLRILVEGKSTFC
jgi:hypothetical protein